MTSDIRRDARADLAGPSCSSCRNIFLFIGAVVLMLVLSRGSSHSACLVIVAAGVLREPLVPARCPTRRTSTCATASRRTSRPSRRVSRVCAFVQAYGRTGIVHRALRADQRRPVRSEHGLRPASRRSTFPFIEYAGVAATAVIVGYGPVGSRHRASSKSAWSPRSCCTSSRYSRPINPAQPALQRGAGRPAPRLQKVVGVLDTPRLDQGTAGAPFDLPASRRDRRSTAVTFRVRRQRPGVART